uniref:Uncharacterized protein n=1 Tax=Craspedostauros australis TaxID=1486917 RepID=A0A6T6EP97_9STRA|eukprot:CAMPEP_0198108134 /NCGR_PEP_ID=MMETSP1442-20131203/226_1 /TAXON_ID= /ORGANISM="Craspedostauros australis, Strain CCMP3328" /LENGTH=215 /DNA_ID=CAMNT_0043763347 /DNA_START=31 /DNA_END=678 /DNA_ORIENTATION=-
MKRSSSIIDDASQGGDASTQFHEDETLQDDISSSRRKFCVERCNSISSLSLTMLGDDSHSSEFDDSFIMGSAKLAYGASHLPPGTYLDDSFTLPPGEPGEDAQHGSWLDKSTSEYRWKASIADIMALDGEEDSNDADAHAMLATRMAPRAKMGNPGSLSLAAPPPPPPVSRTLTPTSIRGKRRSSASRKQRFIPLPRRQPSYHSIVEHDDSPDAS